MNPAKKKRKRDRYRDNRIARGLTARATPKKPKVKEQSQGVCRECCEPCTGTLCDFCWAEEQNGGECFD